MILDGIAGSEAIDKSGEILCVDGADLSLVDENKVYVNYEHKSGESGTSLDQVGKVIFAHKIFKESDCQNKRQRELWKGIELPFIYFIVRLADEAGHEGAKALAALIRDELKHEGKINISWSVEGATLSRDGNKLTKTFIKQVALTTKACNGSVRTGIVEDPSAPPGYELKTDKEKKDILEGLTEKSEKGVFEITSYEMEYNPELQESELEKTLAAGSYNVAPSSLTGGSALQVEDAGLKRRRIVNMVKAVVRDWNGRGDLKEFIKFSLPDISPEFVEKFGEMASEYKMKKAEEEAKSNPNEPLTIRGKPVQPTPTVDKAHFDEKAGVLRTPRGSIPMYIPSKDKSRTARESFHAALNDPKISKIHDYALKNWHRMHGLMKAGKLPDAAVMHATLFSQLSPNTPVISQELMYGHLVDAMKEKGVDARHPDFVNIKQNWLDKDNPSQFPITGGGKNSHWDRIGGQLRIKHDSLLTGRKAGDIGGFMLANNKFTNMSEYHKLAPKLTELIARHKDDTGSAVRELMDHKIKGELHEAQRARQKSKGMPDIGEYQGPIVRGLAPKTTRYMFGMLGGGAVTVPDTHFARHLFGLQKAKRGMDNHTIDYVKTLLWNPANSHILDGIDRYYAANHDAVKHMASHPLTKDVAQKDLVFPAFWKHWMSIIPHERARGMGTGGSNEYTDHKPFWDTVNEIIDQRKKPIKKSDLGAISKAQDSVKEHLHWQETLGEVPAMMLYYAYLVPELIDSNSDTQEGAINMGDFNPNGTIDNPEPEVSMENIRKFEKWSIGLSLKLEEFRKGLGNVKPLSQAPKLDAEQLARRNYKHNDQKPIEFQGKKVVPGHAEVNEGSQIFNDHTILGHDDKHFYTLPVHPANLKDWKHDDIQRINKKAVGSGVHVIKWPKYTDNGSTIDSTLHGDPAFNQTAAQNKLIHGLDLKSGYFEDDKSAKGATDELNHWRKHPSGHKVFIKGQGSVDDVEGDPDNEVAFHNVARDVFGLGDFVPSTAIFNDPTTNQRSSAQARVEGGVHFKYNADHKQLLKEMGKSGDLHKLGMMDWILGHNDRHAGNFLLTPNDKAPMKLIDNSDSMHTYSPDRVPTYLAEHEKLTGNPKDLRAGMGVPIGSKTQDWIMKLDTGKLQKSLGGMGYPQATVSAISDRVDFLKKLVTDRNKEGKQPYTREVFPPNPEHEGDYPW